MAGANGLSSKGGPTKAKSQLNVVKLYRGKGERVVFTTDKATKRVVMSNSKGEMGGMSLREGRQRMQTLTAAGSGWKVRSAAGGGAGPKLAKGAPRVAKLNMDGTTKFQVAGSGKLHSSEAAAVRSANRVAKARAGAKVAKIETSKGTRYQAPGSGKLYKSKKTAQKVAGNKAAEQALAS